MSKRIFNLAQIVILGAFLLGVPLYWMVKQREEGKSYTEGRWLNSFSYVEGDFQDLKSAFKRLFQEDIVLSGKLFLDELSKRKVQEDIEFAGSDEFPLRMDLIQSSRAVERGEIALVYSLLNDPIVPTNIKMNYLAIRDGSILLPYPGSFQRKEIDRRIKNLQSIIDHYPQYHFFAFYIEMVGYTRYYPGLELFPAADKGQSLRYFEAHKPEKLAFGKLAYKNLDEYAQNHFHSDHHWNIRGAWKGYQNIYHLIAPRYPEISPMLAVKGFTPLKEIPFSGSLARDTLYPIQPDVFEYENVDLPPYQTFIQGTETALNLRAQILSGNYPEEKRGLLYDDFWDGHPSAREYRFENGARRNLLIIGDSFMAPISVYIASHYHLTYVVIPREAEEFSLSGFLKDHKVDDILIAGESIFTSRQWDIAP